MANVPGMGLAPRQCPVGVTVAAVKFRESPAWLDCWRKPLGREGISSGTGRIGLLIDERRIGRNPMYSGCFPRFSKYSFHRPGRNLISK